MTDQDKLEVPAPWLIGGGEMGKLIRSIDWTNSPLGPIESWPQSLRTTVSLCVASNFPIAIVWGPERTLIYNDSYQAACGISNYVGQSLDKCWPSTWPTINEALQKAFTGEAQHLEKQRIFLDRNGYLKETFFTFSFSPIRDESGGIGGVFHPITETTDQILRERRARVFIASPESRTPLISVPEPLPAAHTSTYLTLQQTGATGTNEAIREEAGNVSQPAPKGARQSILVIDEVDTREYVRTILTPEFRILIAADGKKALKKVREQLPDLILFDVKTQGIDGLTFLEVLKSDPVLKTIPLIGLTVSANEETSGEGSSATTDAVLNKPFSKRELLTSVRATLAAARAREVEELHRSRFLLEQITATSPDVLFIFDIVKMRNVYCSTRIHAVLGYTPEEFQSAHLHQGGRFFHPDEMLRLVQWLSGFTSPDDKAIHELELRVMHADGRYRWFHVRAAVFQRLDDGSVKQIIGTGRDITDEKAAREALRLSEERQRFSLEAGAIGAWDMDLKTGTVWRSPTHDRIFGCQPDLSEWTHQAFLDSVLPEDRERVNNAFQEALQTNGCWDIECRIQRTDSAVRWISNHGRIMQDRDGNPAHVYGTVYDITEQLQIKESLQQKTNILQMILNSMSEGVVVCNAKGELILVNKSAEQLLNMDGSISDLHDLATRYEWYLADGVTPCSCDMRPLARALKGERVADFEIVIRNLGRNINLIANNSSVPLLDPEGNIVGALNVFRDVTASKRAMQDLHNAEQHFKLLVEGTTDYAIFMLDADGHVVSWNPGAQRILGYEQNEVIGKHVSIFYTEEDIKKGEPQRRLNQTILEGRAEDDSWRVRKDGRRFWSTGVLDALHDDHGRVRGFVKIMRDNTAQRLAEENTYFLANHDPLTGLANRTRFLERLHEALMNADRDDTQVAVFLLDLDRFKLINDTLGHHVGDALLKKVANRLSRCVRETDTVARLGGDEFVVILTRVKDIPSVEILADKIVQEMARPYYINRQEIRSGTSLGVSVYRKDGNDVGDLLQKADLAMYRAKSSGRNRYRIFTQSMLTEVQNRKEQEDNLRLALENQEFELAFQPQINLDTLGLSGAEVLLRSKNKVLQHVPPSKIIALAEETGLIIPLGEWILEATCRQLKTWQKMGLPSFKVAVNFSPTHLLAPNFVNMIRRTLDETGLDPKYLELEVTEGVLVAASEANNQVMTALKEVGVSISVDDFGTGFSALSYLKNFPVDVLKLDESLIRHLPRDHDDVAIVSAIIKLALDLNIKVVAEGVETIDQLAYLRTTNCNTAQGFLFSPAVKSDKFEALLHERMWTSPVLH